MTTETLNALRLLRDARMMVLSMLTDATTSAEEKKILGDILINLQGQEDTLINFTLQNMVDKINASNTALQNLIKHMESVSENLSAISNTVKNISKILSILTEITSKALDAGLLG